MSLKSFLSNFKSKQNYSYVIQRWNGDNSVGFWGNTAWGNKCTNDKEAVEQGKLIEKSKHDWVGKIRVLRVLYESEK